MRRRIVLTAPALLGGVRLLAGCGGDAPAPPPPTVVQIAMRATADANPDGSGIAKPLRVRVLRLGSTAKLAQIDWFALDADPQKALGSELVGADTVVLAPGGSSRYENEFEPNARFVGVAAAYYDINGAKWRAWAPVPRNATTTLSAIFDRSGLTFGEAAA